MGHLLNFVEWPTDPPPDWWSMLLFEHGFIHRLLEIGYNDAKRQHDRIEAFFAREPMDQSSSVSLRS